jgi:very-short-patch-repair endonuclease
MDFSKLSLKDLILYCKENKIKGYSGKSKNCIIEKLSNLDNIENIKQDNRKNVKNNLYSYLLENQPKLINLFYGNSQDMKYISKGTSVKYIWKCMNYEICKNTFECVPRAIYRQDRKSQRYCKLCGDKESGKTYRNNMVKKNGSILDRYQNIINIWSEQNIYKPNELPPQSHILVKLKCMKNITHPEFNIYVYNIRETTCMSCPKCTVPTSKPEIRIYSELSLLFKNVHWQKKIINREADILIDDIKLIIEVDGYPWHYNKNDKDLNKNKIFIENGYEVLRIRDTKLKPINCNNIVFNISNMTIDDFNKIIQWINLKYNLKLYYVNSFSNNELYNNILYNISNVKYEDSIEFIYPESTQIWDYEKNKPLLPSHFTVGSHTEVWVKCKNNHSFKKEIKQIFRIRVKDKIKRIIECPLCSVKIKKNKRPLSINGINYKSITDCCKKLNIPTKRVYNIINKNNKDVNDITIIQQYILEIINTS